MTKLLLDARKSRVRIRAFAEGLFARLAHDLELECRGLTGTAEQAGPGVGGATIEAPIREFAVAGTLKSGRVDPAGLSHEQAQDCLEKMRVHVFHVRRGDGVVRVEATLDGGKGRFRLVFPNGRAVDRLADVRLESSESEVRATGSFGLSLQSIGSDPVKGPMNAFRMKDMIEIAFEAVFVPA